MNPTALKFGYPASLVAEYGHWLVLLRPAQATLGALVAVAKDKAEAFSCLPAEAFAELARVSRDVEAALSAFVGYERINWLMLMMVDRDVHFHILPRYSAPRRFGQGEFPDAGWPGVPDLSRSVTPGQQEAEAIRQAIRACWPQHRD